MSPEAGAVLDLDARRRIVDFVRENPGLHLRALAESLKMPVSTLEYHTYHLVRHGHLSTREDGGFKSFYPAEGIDRRDKDILYLVRHEGPRRICAHLLLYPGATPGDLKQVTQLSAPTLSFHLKKLRDAKLLREEAAGRTKRLFVEDPERVASVLVTYRRSFFDQAIDHFSEAWLALAPPELPFAGEGHRPDGGGDGSTPSGAPDASPRLSTNGMEKSVAPPAESKPPKAAAEGEPPKETAKEERAP